MRLWRFILVCILFDAFFEPCLFAQNAGENPPPALYLRNSAHSFSVDAARGDSQEVIISRGDTVLARSMAPQNDMVRAIVQFRNEPLSRIQHSPGKPGAEQIRSALSLIQSEHVSFKSDLARIESSVPHQPNPAGVSSGVTFEYAVAINGCAVTTHRPVLRELQSLPYVSQVSEDFAVSVIDSASDAVIGATTFWGAYSTHGEGIDIGIIDTGIDYLHEALGGSSFPNSKVVGGYNFIKNSADPMDDHGHGTHVAGIVAGYGPPPVNLRGVAYNARLWAFKVLDSLGRGLASTVIAGIERALDPDNDPLTPTPIKVINLSLGGSGTPDDPLSQAIDNAAASGMICAVAAGNSGTYQSILSPGCARGALTAGASTNGPTMANFSSRGPTDLTFDIKPDVVAPGQLITSAKLGGGYIAESGTSMATPHVAGAAALLKQLHPTWGAPRIKAAIMEGARDLSYDIWTQGCGRLDIMKAAQESTQIAPAMLSFGLDDLFQSTWTQNRTLTVYNSKTAADTVQFLPLSTLPGGVTFAFNPQILIIPANDSASTEVTFAVDNAACPYPNANPSSYSGGVLALTASQDSVVIPFAFVKSRMLSLKFDQQPSLILVHNGRRTPSFSASPNVGPGDSTIILVPPDTFDVVALFNLDSMIVIRERIPVAGLTSLKINSTDATNEVTIHPLDTAGNSLAVNGLGVESVIHMASGFGFIIVGSMGRPQHWFSSVSSAYSYFCALVPGLYATGGQLYDFSFLMNNGISSSVTLQNDPAHFKRVNYQFFVPPPATTLYVSSLFYQSPLYSGSWDIGGYIGTISSPFRLTAWYAPSPSGSNFWYPHHWIATDYASIFTHPLYNTGFIEASEPDTMKYFWSPSDFVPQSPKIASTQKTFFEHVGFEIPVWVGDASTYFQQLTLRTRRESYFMSSLGEHSSVNLGYSLSSGGTIVASGGIGNNVLADNIKSFQLPDKTYELTVWDDAYRIGAMYGHARARIAATAGPYHAVPRLQNLQFLHSGTFADTLPVNEVRLVPHADSGLAGVSIAMRSLHDSAWTLLPPAVNDTVYSVSLPDTLKAGYYTLRMVLADSISDTLDYLIEPALTMPGIYITSRNQSFDTVEVGCRQSQKIGIHNLQISGNVTIQSIIPDIPDFVVSPSISRSLAPAESIGFSIQFKPLSPGEKKGHIIISYAGGHPPDTIAASGVGLATGAIPFTTQLDTGWQLISAPVEPPCPIITNGLFAYRGSYFPADTLQPGKGYWKKLTTPTLAYLGLPFSADTIELAAGWNLIGSSSVPFNAALVMTIPDTLIRSPFYAYTPSGYQMADTLKPGHGYWVKVNRSGKLLTGGVSVPPQALRQYDLPQHVSVLTIADSANHVRELYVRTDQDRAGDGLSFDLPPRPPEGAFDVRFGTDRFLEEVADGESKSIPIIISSSHYPVRIAWQPNRPGVLASLRIGPEEITMEGADSVRITGPVGSLMLRVRRVAAIPTQFRLEQNYPNPFNPVATIRFDLPVKSRVTLRIFDILGRQVATLADGIFEAGYQSVNWDASAFSSGIYFCRLEAAGIADPNRTYSAVKKMVYLR